MNAVLSGIWLYIYPFAMKPSARGRGVVSRPKWQPTRFALARRNTRVSTASARFANDGPSFKWGQVSPAWWPFGGYQRTRTLKFNSPLETL